MSKILKDRTLSGSRPDPARSPAADPRSSSSTRDWYKHPGRGSSLNVKAHADVIIPWFESAGALIRASEGRR